MKHRPCVACGAPTVTFLGVYGYVDWLAGVLCGLGVDEDEAIDRVEAALERTGKEPPCQFSYSVCEDCGAKLPHMKLSTSLDAVHTYGAPDLGDGGPRAPWPPPNTLGDRRRVVDGQFRSKSLWN
jgi:hypothetical protein